MATGYGQFCPIAKAAEVICDRWTPLVLRDVDDKFLPWGLRRTVVGRRRLVLRLDFHGVKGSHVARRSWWLVIGADDGDRARTSGLAVPRRTVHEGDGDCAFAVRRCCV